MRRETYMRGVHGEKYGIWNAARKCWQFNICEDTPMLAEARLFQKIGDDARKWRFEVKQLPHDMVDTLTTGDLQRKSLEASRLQKENDRCFGEVLKLRQKVEERDEALEKEKAAVCELATVVARQNKQLREWEKFAPFLAAHGMLPVQEVGN